MPLDRKLLEILACPDCHGDIKYIRSSRKLSTKAGKKSAKSRSAGESLQCLKCKRVFDVKDGIPIMLPKDFKED